MLRSTTSLLARRYRTLPLNNAVVTEECSLMSLLQSRRYSPVSTTTTYTTNHRYSSTSTSSEEETLLEEVPKSMSSAQTINEVLTSIEEQAIQDEQRRQITKPTPYFSLLHYPSRASWRSSDYLLGTPPSQSSSTSSSTTTSTLSKSTTAANSLLSQTQFNIINHSQRTNKQLKRTYKRIMTSQNALAVKREGERRLAANLSSSAGVSGSSSGSGVDGSEDVEGSIEDGHGNQVGDWREKNSKKSKKKKRIEKLTVSAEALCNDPSVALSLSMGLTNTNTAGVNWGDVDATASSATGTNNRSVKSAAHIKSKSMSSSTNSSEHRPVGYNAEQSLSNLSYRFGPNYSIMKRVLCEVQSLLGGKPPLQVGVVENGDEDKRKRSRRCFEPKRVLDFGCGVGSSGAAALDVFGVSRRGGGSDLSSPTNTTTAEGGIEWIHSIDASQSMRETTDRVLTSVLQDAPWEDETSKNSDEDTVFDEELANYEKAINQIRNNNDKQTQRKLERQRKRLSKWEHTWIKQLTSKTRLTFGESIVDTSSFYSDQINAIDKDDRPPLPWQSQLDEQRRKTKEKKKQQPSTTSAAGSHKQGSFDLILCSYTLSELPNVPSSLAAATLLWEKLAPNGILVFVEPGTPDGFGILRSVRSMLLECCPPPEIKEKRKREAEAVAAAAMEEMKQQDAEEVTKDDESGQGVGEEVLADIDEDIWPEECHVIAPCTHNGSCPMSRHERNHIKRNTRFAKYHTAEPNEIEEDEVEKGNDQNQKEGEEDSDLRDILDGWEDLSESDKDELKMMIGDGDDISDDELKAMLEYMDSEDLDSDSDEDVDIDDDSDVDDEQEFYNIDHQEETSNEAPNNKDPSTMAQTDVFGTSFCSFVHQFPGGTSRKKGEKFTYLVLQKRVPDLNDSSSEAVVGDNDEALLDEIDVVDMMSESVYHGQQLKKEELKKRLNQKRLNAMNGKDSNGQEEIETYDTHHLDQSFETLQQAVEVEDAFLDSNVDRLGLEMLTGDDRRKGWGRLIRAPLKKKGHVLIDYCSAGCGGSCPKNNIYEDDWFEERQDLSDGTQGRITRQKVSKGWSARSAPGSYSAARRARWGGLWPDILERVKRKQRN